MRLLCRKPDSDVEQRQKEADEALIMARVEHSAMELLKHTAESIKKRNEKMQTENNFGYKIFGTEPHR